jgi:hypothetical protein
VTFQESCRPERSGGPFLWPQRSLAALGMTAKPVAMEIPQ